MVDLKGKPPLVMTLAELRAVLMPITAGYAWGEKTIIDLWTQGAPTPGSRTGTPTEARIVFPGQLAKWLADVLHRQSLPQDAQVDIYSLLKDVSR